MNGVVHVHVVRDHNKTESTEGDKQTMMNGIIRVLVVRVQTETWTGVGPGFMRHETFTISWSRFKKKNTKL